MSQSEHALIALCKQGDETAFTALVSPYQGRIKRLLLSVVKDEENAQDLLQKTLISAYTHIHSFREEAHFFTWLYRIALNHSLNFLRDKTRKKEVSLPVELVPAKKRFEPFIEHENLEHALKILSPKQRVIFELVASEGMSQKEIASLLNIPYGTVRSRLFFARKKLKKFFLT